MYSKRLPLWSSNSLNNFTISARECLLYLEKTRVTHPNLTYKRSYFEYGICEKESCFIFFNQEVEEWLTKGKNLYKKSLHRFISMIQCWYCKDAWNFIFEFRLIHSNQIKFSLSTLRKPKDRCNTSILIHRWNVTFNNNSS